MVQQAKKRPDLPTLALRSGSVRLCREGMWRRLRSEREGGLAPRCVTKAPHSRFASLWAILPVLTVAGMASDPGCINHIVGRWLGSGKAGTSRKDRTPSCYPLSQTAPSVHAIREGSHHAKDGAAHSTEREARRLIRRKLDRSRSAFILAQLRMGGWGPRSLHRDVSCPAALHTAGGIVISTHEIVRRAHAHWQ